LFFKFLFLFIFAIIPLYANQNIKNVLLIHSYHRGYKWSDDISKVFENRYYKNDKITLTTVYMDTKKVATPLYFDKLYELYKEQFRGRKFDVVVASDNNALEFVTRYHYSLFRNLPVVFLGINNFDKAMLYENNMNKFTTGVVEEVDIKKNIDLILKIHPNLKKLLIINDQSRTGYAVKRDIFSVLPKYKDKLQFEYIDNLDIADLKMKVRTLPRDSAILWVLLFKDKAGEFFTHKESLKQVREVARNPIYGLWDFYLGYGIVGGVLTSATSQAKAAIKKVDKILKGAHAQNIPILMKSPNKYMFDYNELKIYKIKVPDDIDDYVVINKPFSFYEEYKYLVWITVSIVSFITLMLILLIINVQKRKRSELKISNQLKFIEILMDVIPNPISYKNVNGKYVGCNKAFEKFLNRKKEDIIGKGIFDFFPTQIARKLVQKEKELIKNLGSENFEKTLHFPDGRSFILSYNKTVYTNVDGSVGGVVSVMDDITERVQQRQFVIQQSKLAEMGEMIAAVAHQWNEPLVELSAILQDMEFSYKEGEMDEEKMKGFVNESMMQIQYMSKTLKDFRNFLKPSTKKSLFCTKKALEEVIEIVGRQVFYAHINLNVTCKDEEVLVYGYENEFKQVLLNIINNAKNKILEQKRGKNINIKLSANKGYSKIRIMDDAGEIPEEIINFIFDPYFTTNKDGTGLGLYMAKVIIEDKMGGIIRAYNYVNKAVFDIILVNKEGGKIEDFTFRR
jgi:PAS domain S-box-containing protein